MFESLLSRILAQREIVIDTAVGKKIYDDSQKCYENLLPKYHRGLSSVDSLISVVLEEARRAGNTTGDNMTVQFTVNGGTFYVDDSKRNDKWNYQRQNSQQWKKLEGILGRVMTHKELLKALMSLRPSLEFYDFSGESIDQKYSDIVAPFRVVEFKEINSLTSTPLLTDGKAGKKMEVNLEPLSRGKNDVVELPSEIYVRMPFTRGGEDLYVIPLQLEVGLNKERGEAEFMLFCPELDSIHEKALLDEVKKFRDKTSELPNILSVLDY